LQKKKDGISPGETPQRVYREHMREGFRNKAMEQALPDVDTLLRHRKDTYGARNKNKQTFPCVSV
jgi:hypothetical protein